MSVQPIEWYPCAPTTRHNGMHSSGCALDVSNSRTQPSPQLVAKVFTAWGLHWAQYTLWGCSKKDHRGADRKGLHTWSHMGQWRREGREGGGRAVGTHKEKDTLSLFVDVRFIAYNKNPDNNNTTQWIPPSVSIPR